MTLSAEVGVDRSAPSSQVRYLTLSDVPGIISN